MSLAAATSLRRIGTAALFGAASLIAIAAVVFAVLLILQARSEAMDAEVDRLARYEAEIAARPQLEKELQSLRQQEAAMPGALGGENAAVAGARLQAQMRTLVEEAGGAVRSTQDLPPARRQGFEQINVVCEFSLSLHKLGDLLHRLDGTTPYVFVDDAVIQANDSGQSGQSLDPNPQLALRLTIHAFRVAGGA
jgi:general secretion pathway protein M